MKIHKTHSGTFNLLYKNENSYDCDSAFVHLPGQGLQITEWTHECGICTLGATGSWALAVSQSQQATVEVFIEYQDHSPATTNGISDSRRIWAWADDGGSDINAMIGQNVLPGQFGRDIDIRGKTQATTLRFDSIHAYGSFFNIPGEQGFRTENKVTHFVYVLDSPVRKLYMDGVLIWMATEDEDGFVPPSLPFCMFNHWQIIRPWAGKIFFGAFYEKALDEATIQAHHQAGYDVVAASGSSDCPLDGQEEEEEDSLSPFTSFLLGTATSVGLLLLVAVINFALADKKPPPVDKTPNNVVQWDSASQMSAAMGSHGSASATRSNQYYDPDMTSTGTGMTGFSGLTQAIVPDVPEDESPYLE